MSESVSRRLNFSRGLLLVTVASMAFTAPSVLGQGNAALSGAAATVADAEIKLPVFDVVSVKPNKSDNGMMRVMNKPDGYTATNVSLKMLIQMAYGIRQDLISGGPDWVDSAHFDLDAKVDGADVDTLKKLSPEQRRMVLRPALEDRFKLKVHTETKQLPVFELGIAKGGTKLKEASPDATYPNGFKGFDGVAHGGMLRMGNGEFQGQGVEIKGLVNMLSQQLRQTVIDKTGLTGKYDFELNWTPDDGLVPMFHGTDGSPQKADPAPDASGPTIFTALQEQLGLKLQSAKGPVETLVIDHVEMPSEN